MAEMNEAPGAASEHAWSSQNSQFASWNRFRATVGVDFGKVARQDAIRIVFS
jgi:hypothetical protein